MDHSKEIRTCLKCKNKVPFSSIRNECILGNEWILCQNCVKPHIRGVVDELESFRRSIEFYSVDELKKKMGWLRNEIGNWGEDITLLNDDLSRIQKEYLDYELLLIEILIERYGDREKREIREKLMNHADDLEFKEEIY